MRYLRIVDQIVVNIIEASPKYIATLPNASEFLLETAPTAKGSTLNGDGSFTPPVSVDPRTQEQRDADASEATARDTFIQQYQTIQQKFTDGAVTNADVVLAVKLLLKAVRRLV